MCQKIWACSNLVRSINKNMQKELKCFKEHFFQNLKTKNFMICLMKISERKSIKHIKSIKIVLSWQKVICSTQFSITHAFTALWAIKNKEMAAYLVQRRNFHNFVHIFRNRVTSLVKFVTLVKFLLNQSSSYKCCHFFVFYGSESCKVVDSRELSRKKWSFVWIIKIS